MLETSARLLKLLSLLQTHHEWSGTELAERLSVTTRTVRRDVERLRDLGYPVHAVQGTAGYVLGAGAVLPPLLLDDEEAVAVVVGLRTAAGGSVAGIEEASLRALSKLEQVLPSRLRHRVNTLHTATVRAGAAPGPQVSAETLMSIAEACRRHEGMRIDYTSHHGAETTRAVEPHSLVSFGRHWYLVAFDIDRDDWRTFRVDRLVARTPTGPRFTPRQPPYDDVATYLAHQLSSRTWPYQATVTLHESAGAVAERVWPGMGVVEAIDEDSCLLHLGADSPSSLVWMITSVGTDFTLVSGPPELADAFRAQAARCLRAVQ
ncbi:Predicted DNA-binding transcriptional regulator YafY, contains an HTH and WYL domains [Amycolatopsis marina]|uniref:Predicted DNA-binding transcriptional regulator YafY, contains an HTH and WYL domains n=1 Tax=Amycolatopsis marina TaxID=490629 RepID=A0A1I1BHZ3_9PSEU|nr:YafY family protein [Amycolatopsis marina]SFB48093.1 Predicted DNA-binding transcriptional regulator YafY, contains an HTH and WYL domains [Amycolatopsis marina]